MGRNGVSPVPGLRAMWMVAVVLNLSPLLVQGAAAETKKACAPEDQSLWSDGAFRCLDAKVASDACCCRETAAGVEPEVWSGRCTLKKGALVVTTQGSRVDYADGRRVLIRGVAFVAANPYWQGVAAKAFRLEILGGAEVWTDGQTSVELESPSVALLKGEAGSTELGYRLDEGPPYVLAPGESLAFDPSNPPQGGGARVVADDVLQSADAGGPPTNGGSDGQVAGCASAPERRKGVPYPLLPLMLAAFGLWVWRRARRST